MITFYLDEKEKTLYVYQADIVFMKVFNVGKLEPEIHGSRHLIYGTGGNYVGIIYGIMLKEKIN